MVYLRTLNSRMKDFFHDVWLLARQFAFDGSVLEGHRRHVQEPRDSCRRRPVAFTPEFTEQASTVAQRTAFGKKLPNTARPETPAEVVPFLT